MKRLKSIWAFAILLVVALSFSSCDKDSDIAYTLDGTWSGQMRIGQRYYYDNQWWSTSEIDVTFYNSDYSSGSGYWRDYYSSTRYAVNRISWNVNNGNIYIQFLDSGEKAIISDYSLNDRSFQGKIRFYYSGTWSYGSSEYDFVLYKTSNSYNWGSYNYGYGWWDSYYAKPKQGSMTSDSDSVKVAK